MKKGAGQDDLTTVGGRLRAAAAEANVKQRAIAEHFDITEQAVSQWFRSDTAPGPDKIFDLAKLLGVRPEWLSSGKGPRHAVGHAAPLRIVEAPKQEFIPIGRYDTSFSMGPGSLLGDDPEPLGYWMIESQWLRALSKAAAAELAIVRCTGDSMQQTLFDGDWVLVDRTQRRLSREGIYAIRVGDDSWVKRISLNIKTKKIRVLSDNPTTPPQPDVDEDELSVIGRVIALVARKIA